MATKYPGELSLREFGLGESAASGSGSRLRSLLLRPSLALPGLVLVAIVFCSVFAAQIAPFDPLRADPIHRLQGPTSDHLLGTDGVGRDVLTRLLYGSRVSLRVGVFATTIGIAAATVVGLACGYWRGKLDLLVQRLFDVLQGFPGLIFAMLVISLFGRGEWKVVIPLAVLLVPGTARVVRGTTLSARQADYVMAARVLGAGDARIIFRHILPNIIAPIIVLASLAFGAMIIAEATLSFLGLGTQPPNPSWGGMLATDGRKYMEGHPYLVVAPSAAIALTVLTLNLMGDALRDVLDPRLRGVRSRGP